jgi:outer membrane protein OmpA-like peptidoglycan-associated protein
LTDVTPKNPCWATVIIHGHTDAIGEETYNQNLSLARANDVKISLKIVYLRQEMMWNLN